MDVNQPVTGSAAAVTPTLFPPLALSPPPEVSVIGPAQVEGILPIQPARRVKLEEMARQEVEAIALLPASSPEMSQKADELADLGRADMMAAGNLSNRMLRRPAAAWNGTSGQAPETAQGKVSTTLAELRHTVEALSPAGANLGTGRKLLGIIPFGRHIDRYFDTYRSAQSHLDAVTRALVTGQDELLKDNAVIDTERREMFGVMEKLTEWAIVLQAVDEAAESKRLEVKNTDPVLAHDLQMKILYAIRQRRTDVLTQLAVTVQGYLALDMVKHSNSELIRGVERARTTTLSALRTAVIVAQALASQELVLGQISALNATADELIADNGALLRSDGAVIRQRRATSTLEMAKLDQAFTDVFAAMDELDRFRVSAATTMSGMINALESQIHQARPY